MKEDKVLSQKRASALMAGKFLYDYKKLPKSVGETLEHYFEIWAPKNIIGVSLKVAVWRSVVSALLEGK